MHTPTIRKASKVFGDTLEFRNASEADAEFILSLRTDSIKSKYLNPTPNDLSAQREWLRAYENGRGQAYFIITYQRRSIGTVRVYDARGDSFCWGSWILTSDRPKHAAMESALMVYAYAVDHLRFRACHFDVRKGNERVIRFHERFGATRTGETAQDYLFEMGYDQIQGARGLYTRFLSGAVTVDGLES